MHLTVFLRYLHDVHEMTAYKTGPVHPSVCLSVCIIQLENCWTDLDEITYDFMPLGSTAKSCISTSYTRNANMADELTCETESTLAPLTVESNNDELLKTFG
jgi:hypothetical protein